jgi:hypothetical protein
MRTSAARIACASSRLTSTSRHRRHDWEDVDSEPFAAGAYPVVTVYPHRLECRVCGLQLTGEELTAAGIPDSSQLDQNDVDPDDFEEPWQEPDWEDWWR